MNVFVDTSVWSLAFRRDATVDLPEVRYLASTLEHGGSVYTTGLVLQELLQGFRGARNAGRIIDRFTAFPLLVPDRTDHADAAILRNTCRRRGAQIGTIDALLAQLCIRHGLVMLTTDRDFDRVARIGGLEVWRSAQ